jgi:hypothetical protein
VVAKKPKLEVLVIGVMVFAFLAFCIAAVVIFLPFDPLTYHSVSAEEEACADENIDSYVDYTIDESQYNSIRSMDVQSSWVAEDVPSVDPGYERLVTQVTISPEQIQPGRTLQQGRTLRLTPPDPGVWRLKLRIVVHGGPHLQEVDVLADEPTTILDRSDPQCEGAR